MITLLSFALCAGLVAAQSGCAAVAEYSTKFYQANPKASKVTGIPASIAYNCLKEIPFNATDGNDFIKYYRFFLNYQTTTAVLKNPPPSYQQPATDLLGGFDAIQASIASGKYTNQYDFEAEVLKLIWSAHDNHLALVFGATSIFTFISGLRLVSVAKTPVELPKVYVYGDMGSSNPSAVISINGQDPVEWIQSVSYDDGFVEDHAYYNGVLHNDARNVDYGSPTDALSILHLYPGSDFNLTFANGTTLPAGFTASTYNNFSTGITGEEVYKKYVKVMPAPTSSTSANSTSTATSSATSTLTGVKYLPPPYPSDPIVIQKNLNANPGGTDSGYLTGYFLNKSSVAVLSVPTFSIKGDAAQSFDLVVGQFLNLSKEAGMKKVIIDLQGNRGGTAALGTDLFKHFFPQINPFDGSRYRAWDAMKTLLQVYSPLNVTSDVTSYAQVVGNPWTAQSFDDASGHPFPDWEALYGPVSSYGDLFSRTFRQNFSDMLYDKNQIGFTLYGFANRSTSAPAPYAPEDILMVLDGYCTSTCSLFVEKMKVEAGVRQLTFGGLPTFTPMQGDAGSRGAGDFKDTDIFNVMQKAAIIANTTVLKLFPEMKVEQSPYFIPGSDFNYKDQIRRGNMDTPVQFLYEASDCRLFYTQEMLLDYRVLWQAAADAIWGNASCVAGSTGQPSAQPNVTQTTKPEFSNVASTPTPLKSYTSSSNALIVTGKVILLAQVLLLTVMV